ncbi:putative low molecular weight protein-tyrosine-phosphatase [Pseudomonas sp. Teo4]|nr:putative low molecular weight protein-tyrosine-phosphatase [Pseudomonas sp. Teo4]
MRVLFVCLGNICRSPTAEGVLRHQLQAAGLADQVQVASAGTAEWHVGKAPDSRTCKAALARGYDLSRQRAQQVKPAHFAEYDLILAMDESNLSHLRAMRRIRQKASLTCSCVATTASWTKCRTLITAVLTGSSVCWT